jgi:hypothetical protein
MNDRDAYVLKRAKRTLTSARMFRAPCQLLSYRESVDHDATGNSGSGVPSTRGQLRHEDSAGRG